MLIYVNTDGILTDYQNKDILQLTMCNITDGCSFNTSSINGTCNIINNESNTSKDYTENNLLSQCSYWSIVLKVYPYGKFATCFLAVVTNILVVATILSS